MDLRIAVDKAMSVAPGIWRASIAPSQVRMLGSSATARGSLNVLLVVGGITYDAETKVLTFPVSSAHVLNIGASTDAVILRDSEAGMDIDASATQQARVENSSDVEFIAGVPVSMRPLALALMSAVRKHVTGMLTFREPSGRYVETPDNYWTVKVQTRVQNFRVTLRGRSSSFSRFASIKIKDDRPGYSTFVLSDASQLSDAVAAIREAATH